MTNKRGRPKKAAGDRREELLVVRVEPVEKQAFQEAAEMAGISFSAWARERLRMAAIRELDQVGLRAGFLARIARS